MTIIRSLHLVVGRMQGFGAPTAPSSPGRLPQWNTAAVNSIPGAEPIPLLNSLLVIFNIKIIATDLLISLLVVYLVNSSASWTSFLITFTLFTALNTVMVGSKSQLAVGFREHEWFSQAWFTRFIDPNFVTYATAKTVMTLLMSAHLLKPQLPNLPTFYDWYLYVVSPDIFLVGIIQGLITSFLFIVFERNLIQVPSVQPPLLRAFKTEYPSILYRVLVQTAMIISSTFLISFFLHPAEMELSRRVYYLIAFSCLIQTLCDEINQFVFVYYIVKGLRNKSPDDLLRFTDSTHSLTRLLAYHELVRIANHHANLRSIIFSSSNRWTKFYLACMNPIRRLQKHLRNNRQEKKRSQKSEFILFSHHQIAIFAAQALSTMVAKARKEHPNLVKESDISRLLEDFSKCERGLELYIQEDAPAPKTSLGHTVVGHAPSSVLRGIRSAIYQITVEYYEKMPFMSFNALSCQQLQKFVDFTE